MLLNKILCVPFALCAAAAVQAAPITYSISVDLSSIKANSLYSGSVTLANALAPGGSTPITLVENAGGGLLPTTLNQTLSVGPGPFGFNSVSVGSISFTDTTTSKQYLLLVNGAAHCDVSVNPNGVPCETNGQLIGGNANGGVATYSVSIEPAAVPEVASGIPFLTAALIGAVVLRRRARR